MAMMLIQHHKASEYYDRAMDQFEQIYADAEGSARVMALVVHPYIMGAPHRLKYFRKIFENIRQQAGRAVLDRRADSRLVSVGRPEGSVGEKSRKPERLSALRSSRRRASKQEATSQTPGASRRGNNECASMTLVHSIELGNTLARSADGCEEALCLVAKLAAFPRERSRRNQQLARRRAGF